MVHVVRTLCTMAPCKTTILAPQWSDPCPLRYVCHPVHPLLTDLPPPRSTICAFACPRVCSLVGSQLGLTTCAHPGACLVVRLPHSSIFYTESNLWCHNQSAATRPAVHRTCLCRLNQSLGATTKPLLRVLDPSCTLEQWHSNLDQIPTTCPDSFKSCIVASNRIYPQLFLDCKVAE